MHSQKNKIISHWFI